MPHLGEVPKTCRCFLVCSLKQILCYRVVTVRRDDNHQLIDTLAEGFVIFEQLLI